MYILYYQFNIFYFSYRVTQRIRVGQSQGELTLGSDTAVNSRWAVTWQTRVGQ